MRVIFEESESSVFLLLVVGGSVDDDVDQTGSDFLKLVQDFIPSFALGDVTDEQTLICHADVHL